MNGLETIRAWQKAEMDKQLADLGKVANPLDLWPGDPGYTDAAPEYRGARKS